MSKKEFHNSQTALIAFRLIITLIVGWLLVTAKSFFVPIAMSIFFSLMLYPITKRLERFRVPRILAITLTLLLIVGMVGGLMTYFSTQIFALFTDIDRLTKRLSIIRAEIESHIEALIPGGKQKLVDMLKGGTKSLLESPGSLINSTVSSGGDFLSSTGIMFVYTFMFLLYRSSIKNFILVLFPRRHREQVDRTLHEIQKVAQNYVGGMLLVILSVGTLNSTGLFFLGVDFPLLFGFFAACLTVIPYIGTTFGGILPFVYAMVFYDGYWKAVSVLILYAVVQQLEGNFITPRILGSRVSVNALFAFLALLVGEALWGITGMVLSIPFTAMLKVVFSQVDSLHKYSYLISDEFIDGNFIEKPIEEIDLNA